LSNIKNIGRYCAMNESGYIKSDSASSKIQTDFFEVIEEVVKTYQHHLGKDLHSIYIRGSIPRGLGIHGVSDLDTLAITYKNTSELDLRWVNEIEDKINAQYTCINGVEFSFYHINETMETTNFSIIPFMVKTHSICVFGEDIATQLPIYKADKTLGNDHLIKLKDQILQAREDLVDNDDINDVLDCCVWIMKIIVRAGLALVIEEENLYTRDLYPAYQIFTKYYPEKEHEMEEALRFAIAPIADPEVLLTFLNQFGQWLIDESEKWLQVHNPSKVNNMKLL
jgi:uncharacterized protein